MYLDEKNHWIPPEAPRQPMVMSRTDKAILWFLVVNVLMLCFAPMVWALFGSEMKAVFAALAG